MINRLSAGITITLMLLLTSVVATAQETYTPIFEPTDCTVPMPIGARMMDCGFLIVPEDRAGDPDDTIRIAVTIYRARGNEAVADPVFFLHGGPGLAVVEGAHHIYRVNLVRLNSDRDVIVFDQRGAGLSEPELNCPEFTEFTADVDPFSLTVEESTALTIAAISACRERLEADFGVNTAAYTTVASAMDVADLAEALDYDTINLYGISYGTQLAQVVMRDYPDLVRAVALDGILPVESNFFNDLNRNTALALDELFTNCAASPDCNASHPDLETTFYDTLTALAETPQLVTITNPLNDEAIDLQVNGAVFHDGIYSMLRIPQFIPRIPQLINQAANGDIAALEFIAEMTLIVAGDTDTGAVSFSIMCHEEVYATTPAQLEADQNIVPGLAILDEIGVSDGEEMFPICDAWGAAPFDPLTTEPIVSDIPTLLMGGQFDPTTPPELNAVLAENLTQFYNYEFPGMGHLPSLSAVCPVAIIGEFLNDPTTEPDASCIETMRARFEFIAVP